LRSKARPSLPLRAQMAGALPGRRLVLLLSLAHVDFAARIPDVNTIGADLLVSTAEPCDVAGAWRVMNSSSFKAAWLTTQGSSGETPLMAALGAGCGELVAWLMLHPAFDDATVRRNKLRKEMVTYAIKKSEGLGRDKEVKWAIEVLLAVRSGKVVQEELAYDPRLMLRDGEWFLPKPGEWMAPRTLADLGIQLPLEPSLPEPVLEDVVADGYTDVVHNLDGSLVRRDAVERLWYLLVSRIQEPEDSSRREFVDKHIRSIGWSLFFRGSKETMLTHSLVIDLLSAFVHHAPGDDRHPEDRIPGAQDTAALRAYRHMAATLNAIWNMTGNWMV